MDAEHDFREAEGQPRVCDRDAIVAGEREFQPAAECKAVQQGDRGQGSSSRWSRMRWAPDTMPYATEVLSSVVNSLMSAPAMKPFFFAERTTTPRGGVRASSPSR
ncbi:MAG: hypothetical protein U1F11_11345 [Steroidobacteraceae bacterium]